MDNKYYKTPKSSWLMRQFWKACGADRYLLERSTYSDQIKYFCLGGIVIATGVLAGVAGGYAIYMIFEPKGDALHGMLTDEMAERKENLIIHWPTALKASIFGLIWGLIIFNIDRFIVTSTGKGDGTEKITRQEFYGAVPRIIMGIIIALTISKPIEIRMFKSEIDAELSGIQKMFKQELDSLTNADFDEQKVILSNEKKELENYIDSVNIELKTQGNKIEKASDILQQQIRGQIAPFIPGCGPACEAEQQRLADEKKDLELMEAELRPKIDQKESKLKEVEERIQSFEDRRNEEIAQNKKTAEAKDGLLERLKLAHEIAGFWISLFITLLFIVIELTPIFFKMMLIKGPYDYMDENTRELAKAEAGIEIEYDFYTDKEGVERHKVINHAAEMKRKEKLAMIQAQEELNEEIIKRWKEKKKKEIEENPDKYIDGDIS